MEINMEENVKIILLGKEKIIQKESIQNLQTLISDDNYKLIRLPSSMATFKPNMKVLHSCLYYAIAVQKQLQHSQSFAFREKCLSQISDYYIRRKMNFQLYEYAFLCSRILSLPLDKVMHIVYFLVYARLASKPFIKNLIVEIEMKNRSFKKKPTMRSQKDYSVQSRSQDSRHFTVFCDGSGTQAQNLRRQLKRIMNPQTGQSKKITKRLQNRRYFNVRKLYPSDSQFKDEFESDNVTMRHSAATSRIPTIPKKVCNRANSSVITRLKFSSGISSEDSLFKKVHVRRQKFNQKFESSQKYLKLLHSKDSKQNLKPENGQLKVTTQKDSKGSFTPNYRSQKDAFEYFQGIASNIKTTNEQLNAVRYSCMNHQQRNLFSCKQSKAFCSYDRDSFLSKQTLKTEHEQRETGQAYVKIETNRQISKNNSKYQEYSNAQTEKQKDFEKMSKTISEGKFSQMILQEYMQGNITRKKQSCAVEDDQIVLFNRKLKNKFKLQNYKEQYQQFLKTQMFQKSKEIN